MTPAPTLLRTSRPATQRNQLIARVKDGTKMLSGTTLATPPNPRVTIYLSEDNTNDNTPPLPGPPTFPEKRKSAGTASAQRCHVDSRCAR